jgi:hypothetical protein
MGGEGDDSLWKVPSHGGEGEMKRPTLGGGWGDGGDGGRGGDGGSGGDGGKSKTLGAAGGKGGWMSV